MNFDKEFSPRTTDYEGTAHDFGSMTRDSRQMNFRWGSKGQAFRSGLKAANEADPESPFKGRNFPRGPIGRAYPQKETTAWSVKNSQHFIPNPKVLRENQS